MERRKERRGKRGLCQGLSLAKDPDDNELGVFTVIHDQYRDTGIFPALLKIMYSKDVCRDKFPLSPTRFKGSLGHNNSDET